MRVLILSASIAIAISTTAQNNTAYNIIEGGKTIVELIRIFKAPREAMYPQNTFVEKKDSCVVKNVCDVSFKNSTDTALYISLYRRNGDKYDTNVLTMRVLPKALEYLYEIRSGIYKFKIEMDGEDENRVLYREGEIKLVACQNVFKEIKF
jgi:hypothetical protein